MEAIEALADGVSVTDTLRRLESMAPPGAQFLTVTMPPFKSKRDVEMTTSLVEIGWKLMAVVERTAYFQRTPLDLPERFSQLGGQLRHGS